MTNFQFIPVTAHPLLSPYIVKILVFESCGQLFINEKKLIVPNGNFKLTYTYRNGIVAIVGSRIVTQGENKLSLTGLIDLPVYLDPQEDAQTGTIIMEINPIGAYRFFPLSYLDLKNQIMELADLMGSPAQELQLKLAETNSIPMKLCLLQHFLIKQLEKTVADPVYDYCIVRILGAGGRLSVKELSHEAGYSARWLLNKFSEHLGTGPQNISEIIRFKQFYHAYSTGVKLQNLTEQIHNNYHDRSHFIRTFKRFTGSTPTALQKGINELSTQHYRS